MSSTPFLNETDVRRLLDPAKLLDAIEAAFRSRFASIRIPPRMDLKLTNGIMLAMSCYDPDGHTLGIKLVKVWNDPPHGQDSVHATYLLLDPETAEPRLTIAADYLTDLRTAAVSAVATKFLAREDASTLAIFGTGRLARTHLQLLLEIRSFRRVLICGRNPTNSANFVDQVVPDFPGLFIVPAGARACAAEADVLCTCTTSPEPLFDGHALRAGTHLNLTGAFQPHRREVDTKTIQRSRIVIDTEEAFASGDLTIPLQEGAIQKDHVICDLRDLLNGTKPVRRNPEDITLFKSVGCAIEDLVVAELLLEARRQPGADSEGCGNN